MAFTLPPLSYEFGALEPYIDATTMEIHYTKHHATYIEKLNSALTGMDELLSMEVTDLLRNIETKVPEDKKMAVRNHGGGHANHSMFWKLMTPGGAIHPEGELAEAVKKCCGDFETFKKHFTEKTLAQFGSGWGWLVVNSDGECEITTTANQDSPYMSGKTPILGLDVWEHAFYLKYQNRKPEYIDAWWKVVNWDVVAQNYAAAKAAL